MGMVSHRPRCRILLVQAQTVLTSRIKQGLFLTLAALLVTASASPQSSSGSSSTQPAPAALPSAKSRESSSPRPDRNRAQNAYQSGRRAEQTGDWNVAYDAYSEATTYAPANKEYALLREHARFQLIQGLTDLAERQLLS